MVKYSVLLASFLALTLAASVFSNAYALSVSGEEKKISSPYDQDQNNGKKEKAGGNNNSGKGSSGKEDDEKEKESNNITILMIIPATVLYKYTIDCRLRPRFCSCTVVCTVPGTQYFVR